MDWIFSAKIRWVEVGEWDRDRRVWTTVRGWGGWAERIGVGVEVPLPGLEGMVGGT